MATFAKTTFSHANYASFRPVYPKELYQTVLKYHNGPRNLAVDLGTGPGMIPRALASDFKEIIGTDPSPGMLQTAEKQTSKDEFPNVSFKASGAEDLSFLKDGSVDAVVSGQAAHWFDYPRFWPEMARIIRPGGTIALWGYKDHVYKGHPKATKIFHEFCYGDGEDELGRYWSFPGRKIVQGKYRDIVPSSETFTDETRIEYEAGLGALGEGQGTRFLSRKTTFLLAARYIRTFSSFNGWQDKHPDQKSLADGGEGDCVDRAVEKMKEAEDDWRGQTLDELNASEVEIEWSSGLLMARRKE